MVWAVFYITGKCPAFTCNIKKVLLAGLRNGGDDYAAKGGLRFVSAVVKRVSLIPGNLPQIERIT